MCEPATAIEIYPMFEWNRALQSNRVLRRRAICPLSHQLETVAQLLPVDKAEILPACRKSHFHEVLSDGKKS